MAALAAAAAAAAQLPGFVLALPLANLHVGRVVLGHVANELHRPIRDVMNFLSLYVFFVCSVRMEYTHSKILPT